MTIEGGKNPKHTWKYWVDTCTKPLAPNDKTNGTSWPIATIVAIGKGLKEIIENYRQATRTQRHEKELCLEKKL